MANFDVDKYIKDLSPELQEKARQCKNMDELMNLAGEEGIELSDEALANVSGGCSSTPCPHNGEAQINKVEKVVGGGGMMGEIKYKVCSVICNNCGANLDATKEYYITIPESWDPKTKKIRVSDVR